MLRMSEVMNPSIAISMERIPGMKPASPPMAKRK